MAEDKFVLHLNCYDDDDDGTGSILGPIDVYKSVDSYSELLDLDINTFPENKELFFYVKDITGGETLGVTKGAFFRYENNNYIPVIVGTHSHENKDLLDEITYLDKSLFLDNKEVSLSARLDENGNPQIFWKYSNPIPDPDPSEDTLYLVSSKGQLQWSDNIANSNYAIIKTAIGNDGYIDLIDVDYYDDDILLMFDGNYFMSSEELDIEYDKNSRSMKITSSMVDPGEKITVVFLRNGVSGISSKIIDHILIKLIERLDDTTVEINANSFGSFVNKDELNQKLNTELAKLKTDLIRIFGDKYSLVNHTHDDQYIRLANLVPLNDKIKETNKRIDDLESVDSNVNTEIENIKINKANKSELPNIATNKKVGLVKPDNKTILIDEFGVIKSVYSGGNIGNVNIKVEIADTPNIKPSDDLAEGGLFFEMISPDVLKVNSYNNNHLILESKDESLTLIDDAAGNIVLQGDYPVTIIGNKNIVIDN